MHNKLLLKLPYIYKFVSKFKTQKNYEKLLYIEKINHGDVVLDIGANHGYYTQLFSILTGKTGKVHVFEPVPETFHKLQSTAKFLSNTKINKYAVGRNSGKAIINYNLRESEKASLIYRTKTMNNQCETMIISVDDYITEQKIKRVNFIKCDVEGFELEVVYGAYNTLVENLPKLSIEITLVEEKLRQLFILLKKIGYREFRKIEKGLPLIDIDNFRFENDDFFYLYANS
jgi:FkbM family methyltransferase